MLMSSLLRVLASLCLLFSDGYAQCSWACPTGYTLTDAMTGACSTTYRATAVYSCASGWSLNNTSCSRDLCGGTVCFALDGSKCCGSGYVGAAVNVSGRYSCYTAEGGPGGYWCKRATDSFHMCWTSYSWWVVARRRLPLGMLLLRVVIDVERRYHVTKCDASFCILLAEPSLIHAAQLAVVSWTIMAYAQSERHFPTRARRVEH